MSIAAWQVSHAPGEIASEMPERCSTRADSMRSRGSLAGVMRLAAEPLRKKLNWCPCSPWVTK